MHNTSRSVYQRGTVSARQLPPKSVLATYDEWAAILLRCAAQGATSAQGRWANK
jgi:hypothetical protein